MRKFLIVLMMVAITSFLFAGCNGVTPPIENDPPEIISSAITSGKVGVEYTYDVDATDPEGDTLAYSLTEKPLGMTIVPITGIISWTPTDAGVFGVIVKVSDPDGLFDTQSFNITVAKADEEEPEPEPELVLIGIEVDPEEMDLIVGGTGDIDSVTACYEVKGYEVILDFEDCLFLTSNSKVATVASTGVVTAEGVGTTDILVSYKNKIDTLKVTVIAKEVDYIVAWPDKLGFKVELDGATFPTEYDVFRVTAYYNNGDIVDIKDFKDCTFTSSFPDHIKVTEEGVVTVVPGSFDDLISPPTYVIPILITYEGKTDTVKVTVTVEPPAPPPNG